MRGRQGPDLSRPRAASPRMVPKSEAGFHVHGELGANLDRGAAHTQGARRRPSGAFSGGPHSEDRRASGAAMPPPQPGSFDRGGVNIDAPLLNRRAVDAVRAGAVEGPPTPARLPSRQCLGPTQTTAKPRRAERSLRRRPLQMLRQTHMRPSFGHELHQRHRGRSQSKASAGSPQGAPLSDFTLTSFS